ncbi:MAG: hypothetical protein LBQ16_00865 [Gracilibacteraceae bacterium]|nr:hypothetical protein [Gracilibacteraceae bacterium]
MEIFGTIVGARLASPAFVKLSEIGMIVCDEWNSMPFHYDCVEIDKYIIMPNHLHAIIVVSGTGEASLAPTLGTIVGGYKSGVSRVCGFSVWQRSYHDHIIRDENDYIRIAEYIENNPAQWEEDEYYGGASND